MLNNPILSLDMKLAQQLKKLLQSSGTKISVLSKSTRVPQQTIHNWLTGSKPRDLDQVKRIADHFEVSLDMILYGLESKNKSRSTIEDFQDEINAGIFEVVLRKVSTK